MNFADITISVITAMTPTYTLNLTQDEYVALIAALFTSNKDKTIQHYGKEFPQYIIDSIDKTQQELAQKFSNVYHKEQSVDIIKKIRLDGFEGEIK